MANDISLTPDKQTEAEVSPRFTDMTPEQAATLRERLGIELPLPRLMTLFAVYQKEGRDPSEEELSLLDSLLTPSITRPSQALLAALQTRDTSVAQAFSTLLTACRGANGITPQPTLKSALCAMEQALDDRGILPPSSSASGCSLSLASRNDAPILAHRGHTAVDPLALEDTPFSVTASLPRPSILDKQPLAGDLYSLIAPPADEAGTEALSLMLTAKEVANKLYLLRYITHDDYMSILLSAPQGMETDLSLLVGEYDSQKPPYRLPAGYLVCADEATTKALLRQSKALGLSMTTFARATASRRLTITKQQETQLSLPLAPLQSLSRPRTVDVRLDAQDAAPTLPPPRRYDTAAHTLLTRSLPAIPTLTFGAVCRALEEDVAAAKESDIGSSGLCLSIGIAEDATTSLCALWSCVLALWQVSNDHHLPLLPPVWTCANGKPSTVTLIVMAQRRAIGKKTSPQEAHQEPILPPADGEIV